MDEKLTKFENDLRDFFPDIFKLHMYSKADKFLWDAVYALMDMRDKDQTGEVNIRFNSGKIERIVKAVNMTAYGSTKVFFDK
jgi:hypothetical protein